MAVRGKTLPNGAVGKVILADGRTEGTVGPFGLGWWLLYLLVPELLIRFVDLSVLSFISLTGEIVFQMEKD